jgi:hypothetical protein
MEIGIGCLGRTWIDGIFIQNSHKIVENKENKENKEIKKIKKIQKMQKIQENTRKYKKIQENTMVSYPCRRYLVELQSIIH